MSVSLIVVALVVGALVLCETVLPRIIRAVKRRRQERARALENAPASETKSEEAVESVEPAEVKPDGPSEPTADVPVSGREKELLAEISRLEAECERLRRQLDVKASVRPECAAEDDPLAGMSARQLWEKARTIPHNFIPDAQEDEDYLRLVYGAAKLGHLEAMVKLGDYAYRRGAVVEAYYWTALAELKGATGVEDALREMRTRWLAEDCPGEYENVYDDFSEMQGSFARALLRIRCAVEAPLARERMKELAAQGCEEARLFVKRM